MKKFKALLSGLTIACIIVSMLSFGASAAISVNNGVGQLIPFTGWGKNAPSNGTMANVVTITDDTVFDNIYQYQYYGNYTSATLKSMLNFNAIDGIAEGDKVHLSFYYRYRTGEIDGKTYVVPSGIKFDDAYGTKHDGAKTKTAAISSSWQRADLDLTVKNDSGDKKIYDYYSAYLYASAKEDSICVEIADPVLYYYGAGAAAEEISADLANSTFKSISIKDAPIDLSLNPTSYTTTENITAKDIAAVSYHSDIPVSIETSSVGDDAVYTITSYAPDYNKADKTGAKSTYTITVQGHGPAPVFKGKLIPFEKWSVSAPSKGDQAKVVSVTDDPTFDNVYQYQYYGNYTTATLKSMLNFNEIENYNIGDKVHFSFYYRYRTGLIDGYNYVAASNLKFDMDYGTKHVKAYTKTNAITDSWQRADLDLVINGTYNYYSVFLYAPSVSDLICVEIAEPELYYMADAESSDITAELAKSDIKSVSVLGKDIDLAQNPASYTTDEVLTIDDIAAAAYYDGKNVKITQQDSGETSTFTITSYAPDYNLLTGTGNKSEYTVTGKRAVIHLANNDMGYAVISNDGNLFYGSPTAKGTYANVETVTNDNITADNPFASYYTWQIEKFSVEGDNKQNFIRVYPISQPAVAPQAGGYVYASFYYRAYNRFQNNTGETVDGNKWRMYPSVTVGNNDNAYYRPGSTTAKYFDANVDTASVNDIQGWSRLSWIQPLEGGEGDMSFKLAAPLTNTEGIISGDNKKIDIAQVEVVYLGVPTGTTDSQTIIDQTINNALNSFALKSVTVGGADVLAQNPASYSAECKLPAPVVSAWNLWGINQFVNKVRVSDDETKYIAYAPAYDWLDPTDNKKAEYTVTMHKLVDFDDMALKFGGVAVEDFSTFEAGDYTVSFNVTNESTDPFASAAIVAAYRGGKLIGCTLADVKADASTIDKNVSVDITLSQAPTQFKVFMLNDVSDIIPLCAKTIINSDGIN